MNIQYKSLSDIDKAAIIDLMNHPLVRRQMPLLRGTFDEKDCDQFIASKEQLWATHGYGPWAFVINQQFAGWGGLQSDQDAADLALVLHPDFWGMGKVLYKEIIDKAFNELGLDTIQVLFPPSRTRIQGLLRLGFKKDKELMIGEERFIRFLLHQASAVPTPE